VVVACVAARIEPNNNQYWQHQPLHQIKMPSNKSIASSPAVLLPAMAIVALLLMASALAQPPNGGGVHCSCDDTLAVAGGFHSSCNNTIAGDGKLSRAVQG